MTVSDTELARAGRRPWRSVLVTLVVFVLAATAWVLGVRVQSTNEAAADAEAPRPSIVTAAIEERVIEETYFARGTVQPEHLVPVRVPASAVTAPAVGNVLVVAGTVLQDGQQILDVGGRPIFVFAGDVPLHRDLGPMMTGPDVVALQAALARQGCPADADDGTFGPSTKQCVSQLYQRAGYQWLPASESETTDLALAQSQVVSTAAALDEAEAALRAAQEGPSASEVAAAAAARDAAVAHLSAAESAVDPDTGRIDGVAVADARAQLLSAEAELDRLTRTPDTRTESAAVRRATHERDQAADALGRLESGAGPTVPIGEIVFAPAGSTVHRIAARGASIDSESAAVPLAELASGGTQVTAQISPADAAQLEIGMPARLTVDGSGDAITGRVSHLTTGRSDDGEATASVHIQSSDEVPPAWESREVTVAITTSSSQRPVVAVPLVAVLYQPDGTAYVRVATSNGTLDQVEVRTGFAAEGYVELLSRDERIRPGDAVVVGQ